MWQRVLLRRIFDIWVLTPKYDVTPPNKSESVYFRGLPPTSQQYKRYNCVVCLTPHRRRPDTTREQLHGLSRCVATTWSALSSACCCACAKEQTICLYARQVKLLLIINFEAQLQDATGRKTILCVNDKLRWYKYCASWIQHACLFCLSSRLSTYSFKLLIN